MPDPVFVTLSQEQFQALLSDKSTATTPNSPPFFSTLGRPEYDLNMKMLVDRQMQDILGKAPYPNAWEQLSLVAAGNNLSLSNLVNNNSALTAHVLNMGTVLAGQIGVSQGQVGVPMTQAPVGPIRTAAGDATVQMPPGAAYPPNRQSDQMGAVASGAVDTAAASTAVAAAGIATANVAVSSALAAFVAAVNNAAANLANAITPVTTTAAGGASTPSQTSPKPATGA